MEIEINNGKSSGVGARINPTGPGRFSACSCPPSERDSERGADDSCPDQCHDYQND